MKLGEITTDQLISLTVARGDSSASLTTDPAFAVGEALYVKPFTHNGSVISFEAPDLSISMLALKEDSVPYFWHNVSVSRRLYNGSMYHVITSSVEGARYNRRTAFRVFVGENAECTVVDKGIKVPVLIKDMSATGIGLLVDPQYSGDFAFGIKLHIKFVDSPMRFSMDVMARVVRVLETETDYIYGCEFSGFYPEVGRYVTSKQVKNKKRI